MGFFDLFSKKEKKETLDNGLQNTKTSVFSKIAHAVAGKSKVDDDVLDDLEDVLITSDVGVNTTLDVIRNIEARVARDKYVGTSELNRILKEEIIRPPGCRWQYERQRRFRATRRSSSVRHSRRRRQRCGQNHHYRQIGLPIKAEGKKVILGAADTFRAAAIEQLDIWGQRIGVPVVKQKMGADPASVAYDTVAHAKAEQADVVIIDTAGRLHNKVGLMNELSKIKKSDAKAGCRRTRPSSTRSRR